jgi:hypothetical protein
MRRIRHRTVSGGAAVGLLLLASAACGPSRPEPFPPQGTAGPPVSADRGVVDAAVRRGLEWLAHHQAADGRWSSSAFAGACRSGRAACVSDGPGYEGYDVGVTGLALQAFLVSADTPPGRDIQSLPDRDVVARAVAWLISTQDAEGCLGGRTSKYLYNHAVGTLALCTACRVRGDEAVRRAARRAVDFLVAAQNAGRAWRYEARSGENDTSVTGWCVLALKSAELTGLSVPASCYEGARAWLDEVTDEFAIAGYNDKYTGQVVIPDKNDNYSNHEAMTAIAIVCRIAMDRRRDAPLLTTAAEVLSLDLPAWDGLRIDYYHWFFGSLALYQFHGPNGPYWTIWRGRVLNALLDHQRKSGDTCIDGSWDSSDRWGFEGGRVYATAINVLTLEIDALFPLFVAGSPISRTRREEGRPLTPEEMRVIQHIRGDRYYANWKAKRDREIEESLLSGDSSSENLLSDVDACEVALRILHRMVENQPDEGIRESARERISKITQRIERLRREASILACIRALCSDKAAVRDKAVLDLAAFGDDAIEPLREAAAGPPDTLARPVVMEVLTRLANTSLGYEETLATLRRTKVDMDLKERPLKEMVDIFRQATGLSFEIDDAVASRDVKITIRVRELSARMVLSVALAQVGLAYALGHNKVRICEPGELR